MNHPGETLQPSKPLGKVDLTILDEVWGWEAYLDGSGRSEDSADVELGEGETVKSVTDEALLLGLGLKLSNPLARGCEAHIYRTETEPATIYRWEGGEDVTDTGCWKKVV